jgi:hypothetical protein
MGWRLILWFIKSLWPCKSWHTTRKAKILWHQRDSQQITKIVFDKFNKWLQANLLALNFNKTKFIQFSGKQLKTPQALIQYEDKYIENTNNTDFLGLVMDNTLSWQPHLDKLSSKLSSAAFTLRTLKPLLTLSNLKVIYHSYVHSIIWYGLIFGGNSSYSNIIFKIQKRIIRITTHSNNRTSCWELFKRLKILPIQSQYILSLAMFVIGNQEEFTTNSNIHSHDTCRKSHLHPPSTRMTKYQKGVHCMGIRSTINLPSFCK